MSGAIARQHYLAALGIDVWVRRSLPGAAPAEEPGEPGRTGPGIDDEAPSTADALDDVAPAAKGAAGTPSDAPPDSQPRSVRALLDAVDGGATGASQTHAPVGRETVTPADAAPTPAEAAPASAGPESIPRFRLLVLTLGSAMMLVDEAAAGDDRARRQRLGDVLRAARRVRCGRSDGRVELRTFFWPQLEGADVDQGGAAAAQALAAFVRRHTDGDDGLLVLVEPPADSAARAPMADLETLPRTRARLDAAFVAGADADGARAAWAALARLARPAETGTLDDPEAGPAAGSEVAPEGTPEGPPDGGAP